MTVQEVVLYKTTDGKLFDTRGQAHAWDTVDSYAADVLVQLPEPPREPSQETNQCDFVHAARLVLVGMLERLQPVEPLWPRVREALTEAPDAPILLRDPPAAPRCAEMLLCRANLHYRGREYQQWYYRNQVSEGEP